MRPLSLGEAKARYPHRYTMDHKPAWANKASPDGRRYAPQYSSDAEWYANTLFPGEGGVHPKSSHCFSSNQTWPLGHWLDKEVA